MSLALLLVYLYSTFKIVYKFVKKHIANVNPTPVLVTTCDTDYIFRYDTNISNILSRNFGFMAKRSAFTDKDDIS